MVIFPLWWVRCLFDVRTNNDDVSSIGGIWMWLREWAVRHDAETTAYTSLRICKLWLSDSTSGPIQLATSLFIDPQTYPPTDAIIALEPEGVPLA